MIAGNTLLQLSEGIVKFSVEIFLGDSCLNFIVPPREFNANGANADVFSSGSIAGLRPDQTKVPAPR